MFKKRRIKRCEVIHVDLWIVAEASRIEYYPIALQMWLNLTYFLGFLWGIFEFFADLIQLFAGICLLLRWAHYDALLLLCLFIAFIAIPTCVCLFIDFFAISTCIWLFNDFRAIPSYIFTFSMELRLVLVFTSPHCQ